MCPTAYHGMGPARKAVLIAVDGTWVLSGYWPPRQTRIDIPWVLSCQALVQACVPMVEGQSYRTALPFALYTVAALRCG